LEHCTAPKASRVQVREKIEKRMRHVREKNFSDTTFPENQGDFFQGARIAVTILLAFVDDLLDVCSETLHLSFRLVLCPSASNFKLRPHIFTSSVLRPMPKRDHHAPDLFLPLLCFLFPTKFRRTSSACSRLFQTLKTVHTRQNLKNGEYQRKPVSLRSVK
jgi:hypothetical protein